MTPETDADRKIVEQLHTIAQARKEGYNAEVEDAECRIEECRRFTVVDLDHIQSCIRALTKP